jgi:hypothetical protein
MDREIGYEDRSWNSEPDEFSDEEMNESNSPSKVKFEDPVQAKKKEKRKAKAVTLLRTATSIRETNIFQSAYDQIVEMDIEGCTLISHKIKHLIRSNGLGRDDPRVSQVLDEIDELEKRGTDFTFETFTAELHTNFTLFRRIINYQFIYNEYEKMRDE